MPTSPYDYASRQGVHLVSWDDFHGLCKGLARSVYPFHPEIILPVGRGGYYPGTLLAHMLQVEVYPIRLSRRVNDIVKYKLPRWLVKPPKNVKDRRVLVVDEICSTGETLRMVLSEVKALGAVEVRSAVLYAHSWGVETPDYISLISDELLLNPWDREIVQDGSFQIHPEYAQAFEKQGLEMGPSHLIAAPVVEIAKKPD